MLRQMIMNTPFKAIWGCSRDYIFREGVPRGTTSIKKENLCATMEVKGLKSGLELGRRGEGWG